MGTNGWKVVHFSPKLVPTERTSVFSLLKRNRRFYCASLSNSKLILSAGANGYPLGVRRRDRNDVPAVGVFFRLRINLESILHASAVRVTVQQKSTSRETLYFAGRPGAVENPEDVMKRVLIADVWREKVAVSVDDLLLNEEFLVFSL